MCKNCDNRAQVKGTGHKSRATGTSALAGSERFAGRTIPLSLPTYPPRSTPQFNMADNPPSWRSDKRSSTERGYGVRWQKARAGYLRKHPLCLMCEVEGRLTAATVVDHIVPHKGDMILFWDSSNWQPLCKSHHDSDKQMLEKSGEVRTKFTPDGRVIW